MKTENANSLKSKLKICFKGNGLMVDTGNQGILFVKMKD